MSELDKTFNNLRAGQIQRYKEISKAREREARASAVTNVAGAILGSLAKSYINDNTLNFITSAPMQNEQVQFKVGSKNAQRFLNEEDAITQSGFMGEDRRMYYFNKIRQPFEEQIKNNLAEREGEEGWRQIAANPDVYDALIDEEAYKISDAMLAQHDAGLSLAQKMGTQEEFDAITQLASRKAAPTDVASLIARRVSGFFTGRKASDYNADAVAAIQNSTLAQNARAMNAFMEEYNKTGNLVSSFDFAKFVESLDEPTDRIQTTESINTANVTGTGVMLEIKKTTETDRFTGDVTETIEDNVIFDLNVDSPQLAAKKMLDDAFERFNHAKESGNDMTPKGQELLFQRLRDDHQIDLTNITTFAEYQTASKVYGQIMTEADGLYVKDPARVAERQGIIDILTTQMGVIEGLPARLQAVENPEQAQAIIRQVATQYAEMIKVINERYVPTPYDPNR